MFGNNKKDPLVDAVAKVMQENQLRREVERQFNEDLGIHSKKALPFEKHAEYDRVLAEKTQQALSEGYSMKKEALHPNQQKLNVHEPEKDELTAKDFAMLRAKKKQMDESDDMGPSKAKSKKAPTYRHKTSGKEIVSTKNPGDEWELVKEAAPPMPPRRPQPGDIEGTAGTLKKDGKDYIAPETRNNPHMQASDGPSQADKKALDDKIKEIMKEASEDQKKNNPMVFRDKKRDNPMVFGDKKKNNPMVFGDKKKSNPLVHKEEAELDEASYSAKAARAGKDIGKPGKMFAKIAKSAGEKYGSEERGKKVAGAVLAKLRAKKMEEETLAEKAPEGAKFERMVKHIKAKYAKDGLTDKEKSIAYATAWKAKNKEEKND